MALEEDGVLVPWTVAAILAGPLRRWITATARVDRTRVPPVLEELLDDLDVARRAVAATRSSGSCVPSPEELRPPDTVTVQEAAELLGCTPANVRARLTRGSLPGWREGARWRVETSCLPQPPTGT